MAVNALVGRKNRKVVGSTPTGTAPFDTCHCAKMCDRQRILPLSISMSTSDTSQTMRIKRLRQRAIASYRPVLPVSSSEYLDITQGRAPYIIQTPGGPVTIQCCNPLPPPLPPQLLYSMGIYDSSECYIYNADNTIFKTLPHAASQEYNTYIINYSPLGSPLWATYIDGIGNIMGSCLATDASQNSYAAGYYGASTITFHNADNSPPTITLTTSGQNDAFIVKYDSNGTTLWAAHVGGTGTTQSLGIATDVRGDVVISGRYDDSSPITIYNADASPFGTLPSTSMQLNTFAVKYNTDGTAQWAARITGGTANSGNKITIDASQNVYMIGEYLFLPVTIYNSDGSSSGIILPCSGTKDTFIVKYNSVGTVIWATRVAGSAVDSGTSIKTDRTGAVYVTGEYLSNPITVYNADGSVFNTLANDGFRNSFIIKYDSAGGAQWSTRIGGNGLDEASGIDIDTDGNIIIVGNYSSTILPIYNSDSSLSTVTLSGTGSPSTFVIKYNSAGFALWAARAECTPDDYAATGSVVVDVDRSITITGSYSSPLTFYGADGLSSGIILPNPRSVVSSNSYIAKYSADGVVQWARWIGGYQSERGVSVDVPYYIR